MADGSHIEWTDATWNPVTGCAIVSKGCTNCYAMKLAGTRLRHHPSRAGLTRDTKAGPVWTGEVRLNEQWLDQPLRWRRPRRIFVCAHGDLFAEGVPDEWIDRVFAVMALASQHTYQVLTKRPERMRAYIIGAEDRVWRAMFGVKPAAGHSHVDWPLLNVWLGVSTEDQATADERIPPLLATPAPVRFVSAEPLLGPIDFGRPFDLPGGDEECFPLGVPPERLDELEAPPPPRIDWIIVGGESGPGARPMHPDWVRSIRDQCQAAGVAFLFKQWGAWAPICTIEESDDLYHPAPELDPEARRRCRHANLVLHADGAIFDRNAANDHHRNVSLAAYAAGSGSMLMFDLGKAAAGRLLDGREWSEFPDPPHAEVPGLAAGPRSTHGGAAA